MPRRFIDAAILAEKGDGVKGSTGRPRYARPDGRPGGDSSRPQPVVDPAVPRERPGGDHARSSSGCSASIALALLFENYDLSMLGSAIKYIREDFGLPQSEVGRLTALVRLGAIPAIFVIPFVDRLGRRRVFLAAVIGMSLGTLATAFTPDRAGSSSRAQMVSRTFLITASATAFVIVSEELPAARRGWGVGILGALGAFGFGLGALLFAAIESLPFGWRSLYAVGVRAAAPAARASGARSARPTASSAIQAAATISATRCGAGSRPLARHRPRAPGARARRRARSGASPPGATPPASRSWATTCSPTAAGSPGSTRRSSSSAGLFGIIGNPAAGRLGDRYGRRSVGFALLGGLPALHVRSSTGATAG